VVVEGRDLVDLGLRQHHCFRQRSEVFRRKLAVLVLDLVQVLDEQVPAPWRVAEQGRDLGARLRIDGPALQGRPDFAFLGHGTIMSAPARGNY
jgi:hypothetical protein